MREREFVVWRVGYSKFVQRRNWLKKMFTQRPWNFFRRKIVLSDKDLLFQSIKIFYGQFGFQNFKYVNILKISENPINDASTRTPVQKPCKSNRLSWSECLREWIAAFVVAMREIVNRPTERADERSWVSSFCKKV